MVSSLAIAANCGCHGCRFVRNPACRLFRNPLSRPHHLSSPKHVRGAENFVASTTMSILRLLALFLLAVGFSVHAADAASVGMITKVENQAQIGSTPAAVG